MSDSKDHKPLAPTDADVWTLFDTSRTHEGTLDDYLHVILDRCAEWFKASGVSLFLQIERGNAYVLAAKAGHESSVPDDATIVPGVGIAGTCIATQEPILIANPLEHPALAGSVTRRNQKLGSSMVVPLMTPDRECIGVLNLSRTRKEATFSADDLRYAGSVAGHIALAVANGRLLSRLRLAVNEATALHDKLDSVIEALATGIVVLERDGIVSHMNPEASKLAPGVNTGNSIGTFVDAMTGACQNAVATAAEAGLHGERWATVARAESGSEAFSVTVAPLRGGGAAISIHDVSDHERMLREVSRVRRLAEIGQMTAAIAHEIRNPLSAMRGAAQVIQTDPEHAPEFGKIIEEEVIKLNELCNGFLDFARPLELNLQQVDLGQLASRIAEQHRPEFESAGVQLELSLKGKNKVSADLVRVEQVVRNLLLNALQASAPGAKVVLTIENGAIAVQDWGVGMEQASLEKIFTPFFTTKADGSGLGLSVVRKIVDAHGGRIDVDSAPGEGSRFLVDWKGLAA